MTDPTAMHPPQEPDELPGRWLALIAVGVVVVSVVLGAIAVAIVRGDLDEQVSAPPAGARTPTLDAASLRTHPLLRTTVASPHREQAEQARRWGWIDREAGIVHMPLDVAMQLRLQAPEPRRSP